MEAYLFTSLFVCLCVSQLTFSSPPSFEDFLSDEPWPVSLIYLICTLHVVIYNKNEIVEVKLRPIILYISRSLLPKNNPNTNFKSS